MLLGLAGQIGAGKDAVYARAVELGPEFGIDVVERVSFADKLKLAAARALGVSVETLESLKRDDNARLQLVELQSEQVDTPEGSYSQLVPIPHADITVRNYLQLFGTEVGRETFGENFWVEQALPNDLNHEGRLICVTDVRFPNEAEQVLALGGVVVRVMNGPLVEPEHASEQILDWKYINYEFDNSIRDDDFANLDQQLRDTIELLANAERVGAVA